MNGVAWITGANGLIGSHLVRAASRGWSARGLTRADLELTDFSAVRATFARERPKLIIHCAALSRTPACEGNPKLAWQNNVEAPRVLCELAANIPFVFLSTDLVFDGRKGNYDERDEANPLTVYGESKLAAERIVLANARHTVVRASLNSGPTPSGNTSFDEQLRAAWARGEVTRVFADEFRSPLTAQVTARAIWELVEHNKPGLYHVAGAERLSRLQIAQLIAAKTSNISSRIGTCSIQDFAGLKRSPDTSLNCAKVQSLLSFRLPRFSEALQAQGCI